MKKKILGVFAVLFVALTLVACAGKCKAEGCNKDVYQDGYCELHYAENAFQDGLNELKGLFGN